MSKLLAIWKAIDGSKTKIGAALVVVGKIVSALGKPEVGDPIQTVGEAVAGVGLGHAAVKLVAR